MTATENRRGKQRAALVLIHDKGDGAVSDIVRRIERELGATSLLSKLADGLSPSDLNSLLTELFSARAEKVAPVELLRQYENNRYAQPANWNAATYRRLECDMLEAAEQSGVPSVLLSPASLFGSCSAFGAVGQSKIISATRNLEVLSDATNMLALHIALGLKNNSLRNDQVPIHRCTTHRHMRYQAAFAADRFPHFGLFTMVTSGQSRSSYAFEIEALVKHIRFYSEYWKRTYSQPLVIKLNRRGGYKDGAGFFDCIVASLVDQFPDMDLSVDESENTTAYYQGLRAVMYTSIRGERSEIGDMGFTDWTQRMMNRHGERLLISSLALDAQMLLIGAKEGVR